MQYTPLARKTQTMNTTLAALMFTGLLSASPLCVLATEKTTEDATIPPSAPALNQGAESNEEKADKKGEEASGSNSGADTHSITKDAESQDDGANQRGSKPGS